jgi:hypothetical protein
MSARRATNNELEKGAAASVNVPLRMPADLLKQIDAAAAEVKLSKQDVMRLALERGLKVLLVQLGGETQATA